jgi:hypothetical protein
MSDQEVTTTCGTHGESYATFVCQHLAQAVNRGFYCSGDDEDPRPDAWCKKCDDLLMTSGGEWNEEAEDYAQITLLCAHCYDIAKENNQTFNQSVDDEGWALCVIEEQMIDYPDIQPPAIEEFLYLKIGDRVKLIFEILGEDESGEFIQCERMWVKIEEKTEQGYRGILDNEPTTEGTLYCGEVIDFEDKHIMEVYKPEKYKRKSSPAIRWIEKGKIQ